MSFLSYLKILRPVNGVMSAVAVYIAALVVGVVTISALLPTIPLWLAMIVVFLISSGGMVFNDIFDIEIDKINKPHRPLPSGKISLKTAKVYGLVLFLAGIVLSYFINIYAFGVAVLSALLLYAYAAKLKKTLLVGNFVVSLLVGLTFIYGGLINLNLLPVAILALLGFLANMGREIYKTCEDVAGDKKEGVKSIAIKYGVVKAKIVGSVFVVLAIAISIIPYIISLFGLSYLVVVTIADLIFIVSIFSSVEKSPKVVKMAMNIALLSFLIGTLVI